MIDDAMPRLAKPHRREDLARQPARGGAPPSASTSISESTRVLLLTDVRLYAEGLAHMLDREPTIEVIGTASSPGQGIGPVVDGSVDVVVIGLKPPEGPAIAREFRDAAPDVWLVALAVPETEEEVVAWAEAGIAGVLPPDGSVRDLILMIHSVCHGETVCSPRVAAALLRRVAVLAETNRRPSGGASPGPPLTSREAEIVRLMGHGLSNKEIAHSLGIALPTVKNHIHHVLEKLQVRSRSEVAAIVLRERTIAGRMDLRY